MTNTTLAHLKRGSGSPTIQLSSTRQPIIWLQPADAPYLTLDPIVQMWLTAKSAGSPHTLRTYTDQMASCRAWLHEHAMDLDHYHTFQLAEQVQAWASRDDPARSTYNHRLGVISSFYQYTRRHQLLYCDNPTDFLDRITTTPYPNAKALDIPELHRRLAAIDRSTMGGKRDFALLVVALNTGRRRSELVRLRMGDIEWSGEHMTLVWRKCKGGKVMRDTLAALPQQALLDYLRALYGPTLAQVPPDAPVWTSIARHSAGQPLGSSSMCRIVDQRLGITSIHRLRHTFARAMEDIGAKVTDIQARLGHSNLATTSIYLTALHRDENPYADSLAALFGLSELLTDQPAAPQVLPCGWCGQPLDAITRSDPTRRYCSRTCYQAANRAQNRARMKAQAVGACNPVQPSSVVQQLPLWDETQQALLSS